MLHRTHHRSFFHFNPFSSRSSLETPSPPSLQGKEAEMDCVDRALRKSSLRPEESLKAAQAAAPEEFCDDLWTSTVQSGVSADEFFVDDLLDFSHGGMEEQLQEEEKEDDKSGAGASVSPHMESTGNSNSTPKDDFASLPASELSVPAEDLADLEWLSHFVEDSFSLTYTPAGNLSQKPEEETENRSEPESPKPCFTTPVPAKSRSKRARPGARSWSTSAAGDSSSTSSTSSTSSSPSSPWLIYAVNNSNAAESLNPGAEKPPAPKKQRRKPVNRISDDGAQATAPPAPRRCSHCGVQKTPQWRTGPLGAKTLCNACGVRFKSGRLLPEYRPACSPTFSSDLHSNSHRKVLEMRRKKEVVAPPEPGLAVQSF